MERKDTINNWAKNSAGRKFKPCSDCPSALVTNENISTHKAWHLKERWSTEFSELF